MLVLLRKELQGWGGVEGRTTVGVFPERGHEGTVWCGSTCESCERICAIALSPGATFQTARILGVLAVGRKLTACRCRRKRPSSVVMRCQIAKERHELFARLGS
jgi:hypothetical protein